MWRSDWERLGAGGALSAGCRRRLGAIIAPRARERARVPAASGGAAAGSWRKGVRLPAEPISVFGAAPAGSSAPAKWLRIKHEFLWGGSHVDHQSLRSRLWSVAGARSRQGRGVPDRFRDDPRRAYRKRPLYA